MAFFKIIPQFLQQIERGRTFAYRGQSNIDDAPIPSIGRHAFGDSSLSDIKKREREALDDFKKRAAHLQQPNLGSDIE